MFAYNQSILKHKNPKQDVDNVYESAIINFLKTNESSHETNEFLVFLWCWKDFHKDKKFEWPIVTNSNLSNKQSYMTYGAKHRLNVALIYNMIFNTNYTLETIGEKFIDGPLYNKPVTKFVYGPNTSVSTSEPYPIVQGHRVNVSSVKNIHERDSIIDLIEKCNSLDLRFDEVTAKQFNSIFNTNFFKTGSECIDIKLHDDLLRFIDSYASHDNKPMIDAMSAGIFSCILLKIPVESRYFSLKFQK